MTSTVEGPTAGGSLELNTQPSLSGMSSMSNSSDDDSQDKIDPKMQTVLALLGAVEVRDRSYHLRTYRKCFVGQEAVNLLVESGCIATRYEAVKLCRSAQKDHGLFRHVVDETKEFEDAYLFFRFNSKDRRDKVTEKEDSDLTSEVVEEEKPAAASKPNPLLEPKFRRKPGSRRASDSDAQNNNKEDTPTPIKRFSMMNMVKNTPVRERARSTSSTCSDESRTSTRSDPLRRRHSSSRIMFLVTLQSWDLLRSFLGTHEGKINSKKYGLCTDESGSTTIHHACSIRRQQHASGRILATMAPPDVVELLMDACPDAVRAVDLKGRTPLHLAVYGVATCFSCSATQLDMMSSWKVVSSLVSRYKDAVTIKDRKGRTPLLLMCKNMSPKVRSCSSSSTEPNSSSRSHSRSFQENRSNCRLLLGIIQLLCNAAPESIIEPDETGVTALYYARQAKADPEIIQLLTKR